MPRKPSPRTLTAIFLLASIAVSVALLAVRNLYDDEISWLSFIISPVSSILQINSQSDVHPPGMYLLAHFAYTLVPSFRWLNLFPGIVTYAGLAAFLFQVTPLFARVRTQLCLLLLATLHPQLLMWGATYRWYGWWTGLALIALTVALQPSTPRPVLTPMRAFALGVLLAALFYLNYITLPFALALAVAMILRYCAQPLKRLLLPATVVAGIFLALIAPHLHTMLAVHLPIGRSQRSGLAASFLRLLQSIATSEAFLPWHPLAIAAGVVFVILCITGLIALFYSRRHREFDFPVAPEATNAIASIALFGLLFFLLVAATRLGNKPRSALLLIPVLAPVAAWIVGSLHPRLQSALLLFFTLWSAVGIAHLLGRQGLTKATMNDRPEQVVAFVRQATSPDCSVVVTYDTGLTFALSQANLPRLLIVSPFNDPAFGASDSLPGNDCDQTTLYAVRSYIGGDATSAETLNTELRSTLQFIEGQPRAHYFGFDPDAARKRTLARIPHIGHQLIAAADLPDYRFVVVSGAIDRSKIPAIRKALPDFLSGYEVTPPPAASVPPN